MALPIDPSSAKSQPEQRRIESRARVAIDAMVETIDGLGTGFIINLSCHGAMVQTQELPRPGSLLLLKCDRLEVTGRVAWTRKKRFGVTFDKSVPKHIVTSFGGFPSPPAEWRLRSAEIYVLPPPELRDAQ